MSHVWQSRRFPPVSGLLLSSIIALAAIGIGIQLGQSSLKLKIAAFAVLSFPLVVLLGARTKDVLLFSWIGSLTYNRQFFSFEGIFGDNGAQGPYWVLGDMFLASLYLRWAYEVIVLKRTSAPRARRMWPYFFPIAVACLFSAFVAERPDWTLYEMLRIAKFGLILLYLRYNIGRREWWVCIVGFGCAMVFQSAIGAKEIITGRPGVFGEAVSTSLGQFENVFSQENFYGQARATGTMNHPPNLACYLLLVIPVYLGLALTLRNRKTQLASAIFFAIGSIGLACTLSRLPWALCAMQVVAMLAILVWLRIPPLKQALGIAGMGAVVLMLAAIPLRDRIIQRLTGDLSESVQQRADGNRIAIDMISDSPLIGIGLNNSKLHVLKYVPELEWAVTNDELLVREMNVRSIAAMGNGFYFVTVETGLLGTLAFIVALAGSLLIIVRSVRGVRGPACGVCIGLGLGLAAVLGEQLVDFSLWVDPILYTIAIILGLLNLAPAVLGETTPPPEES